MDHRKDQPTSDTEKAASMVERAWSSDQLKQQQSEIKRTITSMEKQLREFGPVVSHEEKEAIERAVTTFRRLAQIVTHAKEKKERIEKFDNEVSAKARKYLVAETAKLTLEKLIVLIVKQDYSGPAPEFSDIKEQLEKHGYNHLQGVIDYRRLEWCGFAGGYTGYEFRKHFPTATAEQIAAAGQQRIAETIRDHVLPDNLTAALREAAATAQFMLGVKNNLTAAK